MSSKKSGGKSNGPNGSAGKSGGGGASQGSMAKSTPKPCSEGKSCGKPNTSVNTKSGVPPAEGKVKLTEPKFKFSGQ